MKNETKAKANVESAKFISVEEIEKQGHNLYTFVLWLNYVGYTFAYADSDFYTDSQDDAEYIEICTEADASDVFGEFTDSHAGTFRDDEELAMYLLDQTGELDCLPGYLQDYFDYSSFGRDLLLSGDYFKIPSRGDFEYFRSL